MDDEYKIFYAGVKEIIRRGKHRMTQAQLGEKIGKDQTTISGYFRGRTAPPEEIPKIEKVLGMSYKSIFEIGKTIVEPKPANSKSPPELTSEADELQRELITVYRDLTEAQKTIARLTARIAELESNRQEKPTGPLKISSSGIL